MEIFVGIKKVKSAKNIFYYFVQTEDFNGAHFLVKINPLKKTIVIFKDQNSESPLHTLDLTKKSYKGLSIPGINLRVLPYVILKIKNALKENYFPDILDYCA